MDISLSNSKNSDMQSTTTNISSTTGSVTDSVTNTTLDTLNTTIFSDTNATLPSSKKYKNNKKISKPIYFKFTPMTGHDALEQIKNATNDFDQSFGIPQDFVDTLTTNVEPLQLVQQGFLYAPTDPDVTRQVIGKGGCYFHLTTQNCAIHFIWHDRQSNKFLFWGDKFPLIRAMKIISSRIRKYSE